MVATALGGAPDTAYLRAALARARRPSAVELLAVERLTEGRVTPASHG
jgi:hypothetical protein